MDVQLFVPCFIDQLYPQTAFNMIKVLEKLGCTVHYNTNQTCCGQPAFNGMYAINFSLILRVPAILFRPVPRVQDSLKIIIRCCSTILPCITK